MLTVAASSSQSHMPENTMSPPGIYHREQQMQKFKRRSLSDERTEKLELCKKVRPSMHSFSDKATKHESPITNTHAQNDSVANQLSTSLYGTNDLKLELPDAIKEPSYSSYPEDFPRNKIFSSDETSPLAYYDETIPEDSGDEEAKLTRTLSTADVNDIFTQKKPKYRGNTSKENSESKSESDCSYCTCDRVVLNISGQIYETRVGTLERFPNTLLGNPEKRQTYYDPTREQYFFDRDRPSFDGILNYYQSGGRLRRPLNVNIDVFAEEIKFYELGIEAMTMYQDIEGYEYSEEDFKSIDDEAVSKLFDKKEKLPSNQCKKRVWLLFEKPESSNAARIVAVISISVIFLSIVCFCLETLPVFQHNPENGDALQNYNSTTNVTRNYTNNSEPPWPAFVEDPFWIIETFCIIWFTIELLSRFWSCPKKTSFCLDVLNIIDLIAIVPYFVSTASAALDYANGRSDGDKGVSLAFFRVVRLVRVFRIFKLSRHSVGLQILGKTLKSSGSELALLLFFVLIGVVTFSSAIYFAEIDTEDTKFKSIPDAFWWAIVTMTTVGYGDMYPHTFAGKLIGSVCALCGILCLALPVPVIVSNFMYFYRRAKTKQNQSSTTL